VREAHSLLPILLSKWTGKCIASFPPVNGKNRRHTKHRSQPARHRPMTHGNFSKSIPIRPFLPPQKPRSTIPIGGRKPIVLLTETWKHCFGTPKRPELPQPTSPPKSTRE
jgi:hypothetical protein